MDRIARKFVRRVVPNTEDQIYDDNSLRSYIEDQMCGAIQEIASEKYGEPITEPIETKVDGRMKHTIITVSNRKDCFRLNPRLFMRAKTTVVELLNEAVQIYLDKEV